MTKLNLWAYTCPLNGVGFGVTVTSLGTDMPLSGWVYVKEIEVDVDNAEVAKKIAAMKNSTKAERRDRLMKELEDLEGEL